MNTPNIIDALGVTCLIIMGGCALAVLFYIVEKIIAALRGTGIFDRAKRRRP